MQKTCASTALQKFPHCGQSRYRSPVVGEEETNFPVVAILDSQRKGGGYGMLMAATPPMCHNRARTEMSHITQKRQIGRQTASVKKRELFLVETGVTGNFEAGAVTYVNIARIVCSTISRSVHADFSRRYSSSIASLSGRICFMYFSSASGPVSRDDSSR